MDADGKVLAKGRVPEGVEGVARLHEIVSAHAESRRRLWSASSSTGGCWWAPWSPRAMRCTPSTLKGSKTLVRLQSIHLEKSEPMESARAAARKR